MSNWVDFYESFFINRSETENFVKLYENLNSQDAKHSAKIMMHQTQRLVSISDELPTIRPGKESLQLLFLLICAENIAKLHDNYNKDGKSRYYVREFFNKHLSNNDKQQLKRGFLKVDSTQPRFTLDEVIDLLYDIRCGVVHEGKYWGFNFQDGDVSLINIDPDVIVNIGLNDLRGLIVKGCINAIRTYTGNH